MAIDQTAIGGVAADLMDHLDGTAADDASIERVAIVVAIKRPGETTVHWRFTPETPIYVAQGLLANALDQLSK